MLYSNHYKQGFTLIEVLVYSALVAFIIGGTLMAVFQIIQASTTTHKDLIVESEANFLLRKLSWVLSGDVTITSPIVGSSGDILSLKKADSPIVIDAVAGAMRIKEGICAECIFYELNSDNVSLASLSFAHLAPVNGRPDGVRVHFSLNHRAFEFLKYFR